MNAMKRCLLSVRALLVLALLFAPAGVAGTIDQVLADRLSQTPPDEKVPIIIYLQEQVDLDAMEVMLQQMVPPGQRVPIELRYQTIVTALQDIAEREQSVLLGRMNQYEQSATLSNIEAFWIRNIIVARAVPEVIYQIAEWEEVGTIFLDGLLYLDEPVSSGPGESNPETAETGLRVINAHKLWELGYTGAGRLVMGMDTGVRGDNTALSARWRGTVPGVQPTWAWHDPSGNTSSPSDCHSLEHGTHTMGIMTGLYTSTSETLGVAPGALWIASNSLCPGGTHTSRSIAAFQWAANPDSNINTMDDVPDVINCSWFDPDVASTQCQANAGGYGPVIEAVEALGTAVVFSAGNSGPGSSSITAPKNRIRTGTDIFAVGAIDGNTQGYPIASFSSRGPSVCTGADSLRIKPEVVAPGVNVRSAAGTNGYRTLSGTSMAAPHVAGGIALLKQAAPHLTGTEIKYILMATASDLGESGEDNTYGHGVIDLWEAYQALPDEIEVTVYQRWSNTAEIGTIGRWNGSSFDPRVSSGTQLTFTFGTTEVLHGDTSIYSGEKYHRWLRSETDDPDVKNHHAFDIEAGFPSNLTSQFHPTDPTITIKTDLLDAPGTTGGNIQFRDPWYIDSLDAAHATTQ